MSLNNTRRESDGTLARNDGTLARNIVQFARVLREAGLPIGPGAVLDAIDGVIIARIGARMDFYWTLHAFFVRKRESHAVFDQAFHIFWRNPRLLERLMEMMLPTLEAEKDIRRKRKANRRVAEALLGAPEQRQQPEARPDMEVDARLTASGAEVLKSMDFEQMSAEELEAARAVLARMRLPLDNVEIRRIRPGRTGAEVDMRATLRASLRSGGDIIPLKRRERIRLHPPLAVLCDISGSMSQYSRMFLHFLHAITNDRDRVHSFAFGTRLTNITRALARRDIDEALERVASDVVDWSGGTRIGETLEEFNRKWSRRVLGQGAVVLLISDGLDRDSGAGLSEQMDRLHRSCRRLIWLNPLLRYDGFEARGTGIRAMLPHVDEFRSAHNIDSLAALADALGTGLKRRAA